MTSTADQNAHPEVTEISDLTEGLLRPERATAVRAHIAECELCADVQTSLEEIRGLLGTLPGPQRMPADIAGRIDAALAAEAVLAATEPDVSRGTPTPVHVPRGTSSAPEGHAAAPTGPGRTGRARRWRRGLIAVASSVAVVGLGVVLYQAGGDGMSNGGDHADSASNSKKADAAADPIAAQVQQLLRGTTLSPESGKPNSPMLSGPGVSGGDSTKQPPPNPAVPTVPECVLKATQRTDPPVAVGPESFRGTDSYLVLLPHPGNSSLVDAFVVGASCTATSPGAVLYRNTYPR
ncbi:zf-HC2 domain-containing protein [Actinacidiphila alni]|uniref:zf-HC2 domain-containing protein n=1 Tax=Actinacidiphila alni TaxID=380248 RepID=UPI0033F03494